MNKDAAIFENLLKALKPSVTSKATTVWEKQMSAGLRNAGMKLPKVPKSIPNPIKFDLNKLRPQPMKLTENVFKRNDELRLLAKEKFPIHISTPEGVKKL